MMSRRVVVVLFGLMALAVTLQLNRKVTIFFGTSLDAVPDTISAVQPDHAVIPNPSRPDHTEIQHPLRPDHREVLHPLRPDHAKILHPSTSDEGEDELGTTVRPPPLVYKTCSMSTRVQHLRDTCSRRHWTSSRIDWDALNDRLAMFIVDDKHKLMYCMIPKAATHTFRVLLGELAGAQMTVQTMYPIEAYLNSTGFRILQVLPEDEIRDILDTYHKVITVRHPLDRLRAVYGNKLTEPGGLNRQLLLRNVPIINNYLRSINPKHASFDPWNDTLTFPQFLHLVSHKFYSGFTDEHWLPVDELCQICDVKYDAVYHVETLDSDLLQFHSYLESVGGKLPDHLLVPQNAALNSADINEKLHITTTTYSGVNPEVMTKLGKIYQKDFDLFGYKWHNNKEATCKMDYRGQHCC